MNKSKIATHIINDIYDFSSKYENIKSKFEEQKISKEQFANAQFILLCKIEYLEEVITTLKRMGYMFARYEKEMCVLNDLGESISNTLNQQHLTELSSREKFALSTYLTKYDCVLSVVDDIYEELKEHV